MTGPPPTGADADTPHAVAQRYYAAYNAGDLDALLALMHEDVEIAVDAARMRGPEQVAGYIASVQTAFPGAQAAIERVVAASDRSIVVEMRLVNPAAASGQAPGTWYLGGRGCEVLDVRDGKIVALHSYYGPSVEDRTVTASSVPSRNEAVRIVDEQAALRRVATLVAEGAAEDVVLAAVNHEIAQLVGADLTSMMRFRGEDDIELVAAWDVAGTAFPIGERQAASEELLEVRRTGRTSRFGPPDVLPEEGPFVAWARRLGLQATVGVPIALNGLVWGISFAATRRPEPLPDDTEEKIAGFTELVGTALANAQAHAELDQLTRELRASRARVVASADEAQRRVQRDVHDGAQQRLVQVIITLKLAQGAMDGATGPVADLVAEGLLHAERASTELRDLVRGILPAALTRGGLRAGVDSLVADLPLAVDADVVVPRLPSELETTGYFVVAEALANVVKHASASRAEVRAALDGSSLLIEVSDDGVGGADPARGTGLTGLLDRVDAGEGTLVLTSPDGGGTTLAVRLPVAPSG